MTDVLTPQQRHRCMSLIVRRWLWRKGYRFRKNVKRLPGTPDIVLRKYSIVIFIHGCFWHGHEEHLHIPKSNTEFWRNKIERNKQRDERQKERLHQMGWNVLTVWECQLKPSVRSRTLATIEYYINHSYLLKQGNGYETPDQQTSIAAEPQSPYDVT